MRSGAYTGCLVVFSLLGAVFWAVQRSGPDPPMAGASGIMGSMLYGYSILFGQAAWPAHILWNKVGVPCGWQICHWLDWPTACLPPGGIASWQPDCELFWGAGSYGVKQCLADSKGKAQLNECFRVAVQDMMYHGG